MHRSLAALAAAGLLAAAAPIADAAVTRSFDIRTPVGGTKGYAHAYGQATFRAGGRTTLSGRLNDVCPKDGYGAYLDISFALSSGGRRSFKEADVAGCKDDGIAFSYTIDPGERVNGIQLVLTERDGDRQDPGPIEEQRRLYIDNP